ncbi:MAG: putative 4-hydroxybenzoate polyprenyltransferase [Saprospiraceae bacterium]|nr:putative 4-hydroxybenzoate polyprenyltransferase [Saprospiraceae bacterium]
MKNYLSLVKFSHTIFALPFALVGFFIAVNMPDYTFDWKVLGLVLLCMVFARNAAMAFNRWQDRDIDGKNPRTAVREIPAGILPERSVLWFVIANCIGLILTTYFINPICFYLSPVAILITLGYSYTKRFTALCHLVLGLGLSLAPIGAYMAVTGEFGLVPILLGMAVLFWVAGFDIIYALQDFEFDKSLQLHSTPVWLGKENALKLSTFFHLLTAILIGSAAYQLGTQFESIGYIHYIGAIVFIGLLYYQHTLVKSNDLSKVNMAFFTTNGVASVIFGALLILDLYI